MRRGVFAAASVLGVGGMIGILVASLAMGVVFGLPGWSFSMTAGQIEGENMRMYGGIGYQEINGEVMCPMLVTEMDTVDITDMHIFKPFELGIDGILIHVHIEGDSATGSGLIMNADDIVASTATMDNMNMEGADIPIGLDVTADGVTMTDLYAEVFSQGLSTITIHNMHVWVEMPL